MRKCTLGVWNSGNRLLHLDFTSVASPGKSLPAQGMGRDQEKGDLDLSKH